VQWCIFILFTKRSEALCKSSIWYLIFHLKYSVLLKFRIKTIYFRSKLNWVIKLKIDFYSYPREFSNKLSINTGLWTQIILKIKIYFSRRMRYTITILGSNKCSHLLWKKIIVFGSINMTVREIVRALDSSQQIFQTFIAF